MNKSKNLVLLSMIFLGCILLVFTNFNDENYIEEKIRIGVSDDTSGFVINYMRDKNYLKDVEMKDFIDAYSISDC
nr:hypothetical protein [Terrisporobacter sp.]